MDQYIYMYFIVFFLLFVIPMMRRKKRRRIRNAKKRRNERSKRTMSIELIKKFIGKKCIIHGESNLSAPTGVILSVEENWIEVSKPDGSTQILNLDYVTQIEQYLEKKKK